MTLSGTDLPWPEFGPGRVLQEICFKNIVSSDDGARSFGSSTGDPDLWERTFGNFVIRREMFQFNSPC